MRGDFSRETFDPLRHFSRVLVQQGRLQIDADSNEQSDILLHYLRTLASDLIGKHGGPGDGFSIGMLTGAPKLDFSIAPGRYYVDGVLAENDAADLSYTRQRGYTNAEVLPDGKRSLVYLDVWERHVTALDDESIREVALGQADTTTRAQVVWQVRTLSRQPDDTDLPDFGTQWHDWLVNKGGLAAWFGSWPPATRGALKAKGRSADSGEVQPCIIAPESRFRGLENQLYRVEIHRGGKAAVAGETATGVATFKWSRNNGSDVVAVKSLGGGVAALLSMGRGDRESFEANDWVEIVEDNAARMGLPGPLAQVAAVDPDDMTVTLKPAAGATLPSFTAAECIARHVQLRRWNYRVGAAVVAGDKPRLADDGALVVEEEKWLSLEDGVQVMFAKSAGIAYQYRSGDYWTIPARTATGDVEWPGSVGQPEARPPRGVRHFYAPLAVLDVTGGGVANVANLRKTFTPIG